MPAKRDRYTYTRGLSASHRSTTVHPLKKPKVSHSWNRDEEQSAKPLGQQSANNGSGNRSFTWIAAGAASAPLPAARCQGEPASRGSRATNPSTELPGQARGAPAGLEIASPSRDASQPYQTAASQASRGAQNSNSHASTFGKPLKEATHNAAALPSTPRPWTRRPAFQSYAKKRPHQLLRVSPRGAAGVELPTIRQQPTQSGILASRGPTKTPVRASLVHKGRHSLVRRTSIVSAARTIAAARSPAPPNASQTWVRPGTVPVKQPSQLSRFRPQPTSERRILQPRVPPQQRPPGRGLAGSIQWQRGVAQGRKGQGGAFQWQRLAGAEKRSVATPIAARLAQQRCLARPRQLQSVARPRAGKVPTGKPPGKLVRIGGSLYHVSGTGGGRSLKRQVTPKAVPKAEGQVRYQRQGNTLSRLQTNPNSLPKPAARSSHTLRRPSPQKATSHRAGVKGGLRAGMIAQIRKSSKFVNQTCFTFCRTGKCSKKEEGLCPLVHEPKNVAICPLWLKGRCDKQDCSLQHKRRTALMPQCMHFLTGSCTAADCAYLHVMLDEKASVCKNFQRGFCPKGAACLQKHLTSRQLQELRASKPTSWMATKPPQEASRRRRRWPLPLEELEDNSAKEPVQFEEEGDPGFS